MLMAKQACCSTSSKLSKISMKGNCCFVISSFFFYPIHLIPRIRIRDRSWKRKFLTCNFHSQGHYWLMLCRKSNVKELRREMCCKFRQNKGSEVRKKNERIRHKTSLKSHDFSKKMSYFHFSNMQNQTGHIRIYKWSGLISK